MAIGDDFSIAANGDIRYTGSGTNYTVIDFHRWKQGLADDEVSANDDYMDMTRQSPSDRATDNLVTLLPPYNIDDIAAEHLFDGSVIQSGGAEIYDPVTVLAPAGASVEVIQNGAPITPNFWTTGLNADAPNGISHRFLIKVRTAGADIDGRRLIVQTRGWSKQFSEFRVNGTARGTNVAALSAANDLNNQTTQTTVEGWTTITNTEGFRQIDVDNNGTPEDYYSEWNKDTFTINQLIERFKWLSAEPRTEDSYATGTDDLVCGNGTIERVAQSFAVGANGVYAMKAFFDLKSVASPTGTITCTIYTHSGTFGTSSVPTGAALATATRTVEAADLSATYASFEFGFSGLALTASTNYCVAIEFIGDVTNHIAVAGDTVGSSHAGNYASYNGTVWAATAGTDLKFDLQTVGSLYELPGNLFRGITHEIDIDTPTGTFQAVEPVSWTGGTGQMLAIDSPTAGTKMWIQLLTGVIPSNNDTITGGQSAATALVNITVTERPLNFPAIGTSTGTAIIGAYGVGVETTDLSASDLLFDLTNTQRQPPNNVTFNVFGLVSTEDRVLVTDRAQLFQYDNEALGPFTDGETLTFGGGGTATLLELRDDGTTGWMRVRMLTGSVPANDETITGGTSSATADVNGTPQPCPDTEQFTLNGALTGVSVTSVVVNETIPSHTPSTGTIRILRAGGTTTRHPYSAWTGSTFTITSHDFSTDNAANGAGVYTSYIDKLATSSTESFTGVYGSDVSLFVRARDGGVTPIKPFDTIGTLSSTGGSATVIRTSDE